jgi:hypothetical protein
MTTQEKKELIAAFLTKCNDYASVRIERHRTALAGATPWQSMEIQDKIGHWTAYRAFNEYTIQELATAELDHWLD